MSENLDVTILKERIRFFAKERDWEQFHSPKNISMALSVEASELVEIFQWLTEKQSHEIINNDKKLSDIKDEIADILVYAVRISDLLGINIVDAIDQKIVKNIEKYPADLVRGSAKKYTEHKR